MPTNEERREVARKLRFNAGTAPYMNTSDDFAREVFRAAMNEEVGDYRAAIDRLADLIEPEPERTCRNLSDNGWFTCSECGANVYGAAYRSSYVDGGGKRWYTTANPPQWNYCPSCGAKVIE